MSRAYGVVEKVTSKSLKGKTYYGIKLENDDVLYRCGQVSPDVASGTKVSFNFTEGDYGPFIDASTLKKYQREGGAAKAPTSAGNRDSYWTNKEATDKERQKQISYQAATNTAISMVNFALDKGYLKVGAKEPWVVYSEMVKKVAREIHEDYNTYPFEAKEEANKEEIPNWGDGDKADEDVLF